LGLERFVLFGHTFLPTCIATQYAVENPGRVSAVVLSATVGALEHYPDERDAAIEHLDFAISEIREMKMQPSLERALRHRGLLKA
jgi:pimeloyl-ACP methyl ester carboxylesterase